MDENQIYYLGRVEKNTIVLKQNSNAKNTSFKGNIKSVSFRSGGTGLKNIYIDFYQADNSRMTLAFLSDGENAIGFYDGSTNVWKFIVK